MIWIHAYERCSPELWAELIPRQDNIARQNILSRVASILKANATSFEAWGFRVDRHKSFKSSLHMCIRLTSSRATALVNSRDQFLLARPFVAKGEKPPSEEGVVILWANQIKTIPELHTISNTLLGIMGFVGNLQGVGVRAQVSHVASARGLLQSPNPRITNDHCSVFCSSHDGPAAGFSLLPPSPPHILVSAKASRIREGAARRLGILKGKGVDCQFGCALWFSRSVFSWCAKLRMRGVYKAFASPLTSVFFLLLDLVDLGALPISTWCTPSILTATQSARENIIVVLAHLLNAPSTLRS